MSLAFIISRPGNKFYYLQHLIPWHFASRIENPAEWEKITRPLSIEEKRIIKKFSEILKERDYDYDLSGKSIFPGVPFFISKTEKEAFQKAEKILTQAEIDIFRKAFSVFEQKFSIIWNHYSKNTSVIRSIKNEIKKPQFQKALNKTTLICGFDKAPNIKISVIYAPTNMGKTAAGMALVGHNFVIIELPVKFSEWTLIHSVGVLLHEIMHIMLSENNINKKTNIAIKKLKLPQRIFNKPALSWINESIIESFAPTGFIMQNYYPNKIADAILAIADSAYKPRNIRHALLWANYPAAVFYGRKNKPIDQHFIDMAARHLKNIITNNKILISK